ncbi:S8 family peptidase [Meiothermus taiwanensis]|jgi:serine protease|uniref:Peptidase S8 and S53 subtilisin kexin sedolisin n=1 Tax=Meiothermus taiwanensis WR-220 TaxID=1339250 RepID=A0A808U6E2_9DEIN|nr:S8 family peptidase [Meiothermus taiwanensis]AWR88045.1 peptidase S8 and S53 subtilisin kexin sedolisin [Meiothermus taiwanensis WR-220]
MLRTLPLLIALVLGLAACTPPAPPPAAEPPLAPGACPSAASLQAPPSFAPGEIIVRFRPGVSLQSLQGLSVAGVELQQVRPLGQAFLYRAPLDPAQTLAALRILRARSEIAYAHPNYLLSAQAVTPNDTLYPSQRWHYQALRLPEAWEIERGYTHPVTVAVVDSGIVAAHPDLADKLLPGYDFYSDACTSGDGDGRDPNPEDTGPNTTYHGSHVSGLIAAATNNGQGVAGVSWGARILPLRALSGARGTLSDVIDALRWAAGLGVTGVPPNRNPAQVINLSLGVEMPCNELPALQEALQEVNSRGVIVVVAAGNYNAEASTLSPASCPGVIVVGATEASGRRAYYSNYGTRVDLMAPGGDDRQQQWVVSTLGRDQYGRYQYGGMVGTSMAAPQVAGVVALMKSKRYSLTREEVLSILKATARPLTAEECNRPSGAECGAGLVDARAALERLGP